jgi:hypothetical protein
MYLPFRRWLSTAKEVDVYNSICHILKPELMIHIHLELGQAFYSLQQQIISLALNHYSVMLPIFTSKLSGCLCKISIVLIINLDICTYELAGVVGLPKYKCGPLSA